MKRFTETNKWQDPWFSELTQGQKLLWLYLCDNCDNSGVIDLSKRIAKFLIGTDSDIDEDIKALGERVEILNCGKLLIPRFISFQFGALSEKSNLHKSVFQCIKKNNLEERFKPSGSLQVASMKVTSKGKGKGIVKVKVKEEAFEIFWDKWPGRIQDNGTIKKIGRKEALAEWMKLSVLDRIAATKGIPEAPEKYLKDAHRWLKKEGWTDEEKKAGNAPAAKQEGFCFVDKQPATQTITRDGHTKFICDACIALVKAAPAVKSFQDKVIPREFLSFGRMETLILDQKGRRK